jgi:hypothetical protein
MAAAFSMLLLLAAFGIQVKAWAVQTPPAAADRARPRVDNFDVEPYCLPIGESVCSDVRTPSTAGCDQKKFLGF